MAKRRIAIITVIVCFCSLLFPFYAMAASTTDASEPINVNQECSLTLSYSYDGIPFENVEVKLYKIAAISSDFQYELTSDFESTGLVLNGIKSKDEWSLITYTLETYIVADGITTDIVAKTNSEGLVCFETLETGLYLTITDTVSLNELPCYFNSALITLPGLNTDGLWQYQVAANPKPEIIPPSFNEIELKVLKLWKGDEGKNSRPKNIEVEIFRDGVSNGNIILSENNNWSYSWIADDDGAQWTVIERNTPSGYTMTAQKRDNTFVLTNTHKSDGSLDVPKTGDTSNIMLYVILLIISGSLLIIFGIIGKRNTYEKDK